MTTAAPRSGDPDFYQWRSALSPASSSDSSHSANSPPSPTSLPEFALSPKTSRRLPLQTYLARLPEWSSATRLGSLYSEFDKLKETNPFGYEANVSWWRMVILGTSRNGLLSSYQPLTTFATSASRHSMASTYSSHDIGSSGVAGAKAVCEPTGSAIGVMELDLEQLAVKFQKNGRRPHSLQAVMNEMNRMGDVVPRSEFLPWAGVGWTGWIFHKVVKAPLLWSLKQLSLSDSGSSRYSASSPTLASSGFGSVGGAGSGSNGNIGVVGSANAGGNSLALGMSQSSSPSSNFRDTYVIVPYVQEAAARILKLQQESTGYHASDNLMNFSDFRQKFSRTALLPVGGKFSISESAGGAGSIIVLTDRDLEIVMRYMQYEMRVLITGKLDASKYNNEVQDHELIIKFATKDAIRDKSKQEITAADRGIIELRETCRRLDNQVQDIEERIAELTEKARACVRKNQRSQATFALRQRKSLDDVLNKRLKSLDTISSILFRIQSSETDAEILQSYKLGASTLASVMATKDKDGQELLSKDNVESTMDRLADVFADQEEVDQAMSEGTDILLENTISGGAGMDEDELMAELDALMEPAQAESVSSTGKTPLTPKKQAEKPIPVKRTTPPVPQAEAILSTSSSFTSRELLGTVPVAAASTPGKRVAELPEHSSLFVKQRKVSLATAHSQRRDGNVESIASSYNAHAPERFMSDVDAIVIVSGSGPTDEEERAVEHTRMETDHAAPAHTETAELSKTLSPKPAVAGDEGLTEEEERTLNAMLRDLEEIKAPEEDIQMEKEEALSPEAHSEIEDDECRELESRNAQEKSKERKETRVLEHS
ncbi:Snf7-domain-containing protein [Dissophora ornata]|nr:hypothetical protein BGZ58_010525 [Dissophora ornata]KAI8605993.1 Snf7-domain-containing protein [Dissophora ornata]